MEHEHNIVHIKTTGVSEGMTGGEMKEERKRAR